MVDSVDVDAQIEEAQSIRPSKSFLSYLVGAFRSSPPATSDSFKPPRFSLPSIDRLKATFKESPVDIATGSTFSTVLYLAYGSNLSYRTFQGRRGIRPISAVNVVCPELKLTFDLPFLPYIEPCFANTAGRDTENAPNPEIEDGLDESQTSTWSLVNDASDPPEAAKLINPNTSNSIPLIGVVYEVTASDYAHILATEGTYEDILVTCTVLPSPNTTSDTPLREGTTFRAHTLRMPEARTRHSPDGTASQPSLRYLTLLRDGAAEHNLPQDWQAYLGALQHFQITTMSQKVGRAALIILALPLVVPLIGMRLFYVMIRTKPPKWVLTHGIGYIFKWVWRSYDWVLKPIFGDGERTIVDKSSPRAKL